MCELYMSVTIYGTYMSITVSCSNVTAEYAEGWPDSPPPSYNQLLDSGTVTSSSAERKSTNYLIVLPNTTSLPVM